MPTRSDKPTTKTKVYICDDCPYQSTTKGNLFRHIRTVHKGEGHIVCTECWRSFETDEHLQNHKNTLRKEYYSTSLGKHNYYTIISKSRVQHTMHKGSGHVPFHKCGICERTFVEFFSAPEPKAQVHFCDHVLSVVRPSVVRR